MFRHFGDSKLEHSQLMQQFYVDGSSSSNSEWVMFHVGMPCFFFLCFAVFGIISLLLLLPVDTNCAVHYMLWLLPSHIQYIRIRYTGCPNSGSTAWRLLNGEHFANLIIFLYLQKSFLPIYIVTGWRVSLLATLHLVVRQTYSYSLPLFGAVDRGHMSESQGQCLFNMSKHPNNGIDWNTFVCFPHIVPYVRLSLRNRIGCDWTQTVYRQYTQSLCLSLSHTNPTRAATLFTNQPKQVFSMLCWAKYFSSFHNIAITPRQWLRHVNE